MSAQALLNGAEDETLKEQNLSVSSCYSVSSGHELENKVSNILHEFPGIGYRSVISHLTAQQIRVAEHRVRQAVRKVDPEGVMLRKLCLTVTKRRKYSVRAPRALWHIDGYHKLIR